MLEICHHCKQVVPETDAEKLLAASRTATAKQQIHMAELSFQAFADARPCPNFMARNINWMFLTWMISCVILFPVMAWLLSHGIIPPDDILWALGILGVVVYGVAHIIYIRPTSILQAHNLAVRKDFAEQHPVTAGVLGMKVTQ